MKIQVNARNRTHLFETEAGAGEKILHAGLMRGIALPYECASGTCGTCKARLVSGEISDAWPDAPGRKYLKAAGEFLMCQCSATTDVVAEVPAFVQLMETGSCVPLASRGSIVSTQMLTHDVMTLDIESQEAIDFDAGQFMLVGVSEVEGMRGWSMVNFDRHARLLRFLVRRKPGGVLSDWLFADGSRTGASVDLYGPLGHATFYPSLGKDLLCIAGGSGIAGMMSILARAEQDNYFERHDGNVFFGVRSMKDVYFLDEFTRLRAQCGNRLAVTVALSDEDPPDGLDDEYPLIRFERGFVHEVAARQMQQKLANVMAYLAGPPPAVDASIRMLLLSRVTADNIRYDKFS
jgi:toluene monooxygenase electron transfer component